MAKIESDASREEDEEDENKNGDDNDDDEDEDDDSKDESKDEDEKQDVIKRTKEIARKVNFYGLPLMPWTRKDGASPIAGFQEEISDKEEEVAFLDTFGKQQFFPVLPVNTDDDDDEDGSGANENDPSLSNQSRQAPRKSYEETKESAALLQKQATMEIPPSPVTCTSTFFNPKSSSKTTPSELECQKRLAQIKLEMEKAQQMLKATKTAAVQAACQKRIAKLKVEQRFHQIIQERYKIQSMMDTTEVPIVRAACKQRFNQLIKELQTLQLEVDKDEDEDDDNKEVEEKKKVDEPRSPESSVAKVSTASVDDGPVCESVFVPPQLPSLPTIPVIPACNDDNTEVKESEASEQNNHSVQWYDTVLKYMTGEQSLQEEMAARSGTAKSSNHGPGKTPNHSQQQRKQQLQQPQQQPLHERKGYNPERYPEQQHQSFQSPPQGSSSSHVRFADHPPFSPSERHCDRRLYGSSRSNSSARSDKAVAPPAPPTPPNKFKNPRGSGGGRPVARARRPVASAVKTKTSWF